jgi:hypothetical protein
VNNLEGEVAVEDVPRGAIEHDDDAMLISYFSNSIPRFLNLIAQAIYSLQIHTIQSSRIYLISLNRKVIYFQL